MTTALAALGRDYLAILCERLHQPSATIDYKTLATLRATRFGGKVQNPRQVGKACDRANLAVHQAAVRRNILPPPPLSILVVNGRSEFPGVGIGPQILRWLDATSAHDHLRRGITESAVGSGVIAAVLEAARGFDYFALMAAMSDDEWITTEARAAPA